MRMRPGILSCFLAAAALVVAAEPVQRSERGDQKLAPVRPFDQPPQIIMVTAGNFEFTPALIHIKLGQHFQLQVASTDKTYGVRLDPFPDGATRSKPIPPGLEFAYGEDCWKIKKGEPAKIVFFAHTAGTYSSTCCKDRAEHKRMKGQIIAEP